MSSQSKMASRATPGYLQMKNIDVVALLAKFWALLVLFLLPIKPILIAITVLVAADTVTGIWASIKEKKKITSSGLRRTIVKTLSYQSAIVVAFILEQYLLPEMPVIKVVAALVGVTEAKSFFENLKRITGIDFWSQIISKLNMDDVKNSISKDDK